jgi:hypothetical protein
MGANELSQLFRSVATLLRALVIELFLSRRKEAAKSISWAQIRMPYRGAASFSWLRSLALPTLPVRACTQS